MEAATAHRDSEYDLGSFSRTIATESAEAQAWFDRGLMWTYNFNHTAAIRCFEVVVELDPTCAIAHWGIAFCNGVNYNCPNLQSEAGKFPSNADACRHARQAAALKHHASEVEQMLIDAIQVRNVEPLSNDQMHRRKLNSLFATAMDKVYKAYPDDPDVVALYAEALLDIYPWRHWVNGKLREPDPLFVGSARIKEVLDVGLKSHPKHPGIVHMQLHLMEKSPTPQDCLAECDILRKEAKDACHLLHMPTHIDVVVGNYHEAMQINTKAIEGDLRFFARNTTDTWAFIYTCHDCHVMLYAAMLSGDRRQAMESGRLVQRLLSMPEAVRIMRDGMANRLEWYVPLYVHAMVRFGMWQDILDEELPEDEELYCITRCMIRYARTLAYAAQEDIERATKELELFKVAYSKVPECRRISYYVCRDILAVANAMAEGEVAYRRGDYNIAFNHLRHGVELEDALQFEPWAWMQPVRHALGALLLEQGQVEEATNVYREDLRSGHHPRNIWALHGLAECLETRPDLAISNELEETSQQLLEAKKLSGVTVMASCYCRLSKCF